MKKVEKISDVSLAEVSGGGIVGIDNGQLNVDYRLWAISGVVSAVAAPVTLGLMTADLVCRNKANKNRNNCDLEKAKKFENASSVLSKLAVATGAVAATGAVICGGTSGLTAIRKAEIFR